MKLKSLFLVSCELQVTGSEKIFSSAVEELLIVFRTDLKISLYVWIHLKIIPLKLRILNPNKSWVIYPRSLLFS